MSKKINLPISIVQFDTSISSRKLISSELDLFEKGEKPSFSQKNLPIEEALPSLKEDAVAETSISPLELPDQEPAVDPFFSQKNLPTEEPLPSLQEEAVAETSISPLRSPDQESITAHETFPVAAKEKDLLPLSNPCPLTPHCSYYFVPQLITVRHIEGINNQDAELLLSTNYSTLAIEIAPPYCPGGFLPMFDLRGHRFDNTAYAANAGFVGRFIPSCDSSFCKILGFNAYYDYREGCIGYFQQIGVGLEILSNNWDLRGNVYIPFGSKTRNNKCLFDDYIGDYFYLEETYESVSYAFNAEIGYYLYYGEDFSLYLAGGPYYIAGRKCMDKTRGGEIRIKPQYKDYVSLDFSVQYDSLFKTVWQGEIAINLPLYKIKDQNFRPCKLKDWQIYQPVERFEVMPVEIRRCYQSNF